MRKISRAALRRLEGIPAGRFAYWRRFLRTFGPPPSQNRLSAKHAEGNPAIWIEPMQIQDMMHDHDANTLSELERVLSRRYGNDVNAFWITRKKGHRPLLLMLVNKALANLHYFPPGDHPGFHSVGHISDLDPDKYTTFFMNSPEEREEVPNDAVIPLFDALAAVKEFFASQDLPKSVDWFEL